MTSVAQKAAKLWVDVRRMNGLQSFATEMLIWSFDQYPEDSVKLIKKQSLKRLKKIRLNQPANWPMISSAQLSRSGRFQKMQARNGAGAAGFPRSHTNSKKQEKTSFASSSSSSLPLFTFEQNCHHR
ncbi:hypothetical protein KIN20_023641 [Parelaphostrongylus tenuis]|uniref:Uncharacterized protein n=1 Tax=Parelaphostrongylus tenuis TaxID=148309 RepID=A0AAD5NCB4_PARTN|nr:hypothetical protein KIN20_023641 [Parelaphostrongylus tenuis]